MVRMIAAAALAALAMRLFAWKVLAGARRHAPADRSA